MNEVQASLTRQAGEVTRLGASMPEQMNALRGNMSAQMDSLAQKVKQGAEVMETSKLIVNRSLKNTDYYD